MKFLSLRLEAVLLAAIAVAGCNGGGSSPVAPVAAVMPKVSVVIVYDEAGDVALGVMPGAAGPAEVYTVVMADGTTWRSRTLAQLEALWE